MVAVNFNTHCFLTHDAAMDLLAPLPPLAGGPDPPLLGPPPLEPAAFNPPPLCERWNNTSQRLQIYNRQYNAPVLPPRNRILLIWHTPSALQKPLQVVRG